MRRASTGSGRFRLVAGMLLMLALAGCESVEDREIRALIEGIAALQEQRIGVMESTAEEEVADAREHNPEQVAQKEQEWEERLQAARRGHDRTLTKLGEALASGDWETAYPEETRLLNMPPVEIVRFVQSARQRDLREAEGYRAGQARWRERRAEIRQGREARIDAHRRVPDPSAWRQPGEPAPEALNAQEVLGLVNRPER